MRDCSQCPFRVELHPEYRDTPWEKIPCATCEEQDVPLSRDIYDRSTPVEYNDEIAVVSQTRTRTSTMATILNEWDKLTPNEKAIILDTFTVPNSTTRAAAKRLGITQSTYFSRLKLALRKVPNLRSG